EEGLARAGRQCAVHGLRRRRRRRGGRRRARLQVPQLRADVHLGQPHLRAGRNLRRVRGALRRRRGEAEGRQRARARDEGRPADRAGGGRQGRASRRRRARPRRRAAARRRRSRRPLLAADGDHGRRPGGGDGVRGDLRPGRRHRPFLDRGRGRARGQRHPVRPRRLLLHPWHGPDLAALRGSRVWAPRHQHGLHHHGGRTLRRREGVGHRPRGLEVRDRRVARDQVPLHGRSRSGVIVEQRDYHVFTGKLGELVKLYETEGIELQQRILGNLLAVFTTDVGSLSTYTSLWGYDTYAQREERRAELQADERWRAFLAKIQPLIHTQQNRILIPTSFSPIR